MFRISFSCKYHFTNDKLFVDWDACEFEPVSDDQLLKYLPRLEESCKVKQNGKDWETYKRFEGRRKYYSELYKILDLENFTFYFNDIFHFYNFVQFCKALIPFCLKCRK